MVFESIIKESLAEEIARRLLFMIQAKKLNPGEKLPPERELAAALGVSRPPLREALRALAIMNIIDIRQGDGTYISSLSLDQLLEPLDFVFSLDDSTYMQLFDARKILEVGITALAAPKVTHEDIVDLEKIISKSKACIDNHAKFLQYDLDLHNKIIVIAQNPILSRLMLSISQLGISSRRRTVNIPGVPQKTIADHNRIVDALKKRDPELARRAMEDHLNHVENRLKEEMVV